MSTYLIVNKIMETKLVAAALLAASVYAQVEDVSREGQNIASVIMFNTPGLTTPRVNFGLTDQEPKLHDHLTPLGQR